MLLEASGDDPESMLPPVRTLESEVGQRHSGFAEQFSLNSISLDYGDAVTCPWPWSLPVLEDRSSCPWPWPWPWP